MVTDESTPVAISDVIQKTMIQVDRKGTQAAAATMIDVKSGAALREVEPYKVYLDRPFVYGIVDNTTGVPIFLGVQNCMPGGE
jgi:serpin B